MCVKILELQITCGRTEGAGIAQNDDALGNQFRPVMRAGLLSYTCQAYPTDTAEVTGQPEGQDIFVLPELVDSASECYEH